MNIWNTSTATYFENIPLCCAKYSKFPRHWMEVSTQKGAWRHPPPFGLCSSQIRFWSLLVGLLCPSLFPPGKSNIGRGWVLFHFHCWQILQNSFVRLSFKLSAPFARCWKSNYVGNGRSSCEWRKKSFESLFELVRCKCRLQGLGLLRCERQ